MSIVVARSMVVKQLSNAYSVMDKTPAKNRPDLPIAQGCNHFRT
jgi:hypothetical protein